MKDLGQELCETLLIYKRDPLRLLLVEDSQADAELAIHEFEECARNCVIEHVWNGEEAIQAVQRIAETNRDKATPNLRQFDVAIVDLLLPGKSGLEAASHMIGFAPLLIIFICSGAAVPEGIMQQAVDKGFAILPKPLRRSHVEMVINAVKSVKEKTPGPVPDPEI